MSGTAPRLEKSDRGVWYILWSEGRRSKRLSTRTKSLATAKSFLGEWLRLEHADASATLTNLQLWKLYEREQLEPHTVSADRYKRAWATLQEVFGALEPNATTQKIVDRYAADRALGRYGTKPANTATIRLELSLLLRVWNYAIKHRHIASTEAPPLNIPAGNPPRERWLRADEVEKLLVATEHWRRDGRLARVERFCWLALQTGARRNAIETLTWAQVDFEMRVIHFNPEGRRQTKKRRASVPISDKLLPILQRAQAERAGPFVLDNPGEINTTLLKVAERAGLAGVSAHVLRHTVATHMARKGVPLWKIAGVLGNTAAMVESVYAKHAPDGLVDAVNAMG